MNAKQVILQIAAKENKPRKKSKQQCSALYAKLWLQKILKRRNCGKSSLQMERSQLWINS